MTPKRLDWDWNLILSVAEEVAATEAHPSRAKVASRIGRLANSLTVAAKRDGMAEKLDAILTGGKLADSPGMQKNADGSAEVTSVPMEKSPWTPKALLEAHGFVFEDWTINSATANRWGNPDDPMHQLKLRVVPRSGLIVVPDPSDWTPPPKPKKRKHDGPRKVVICGDHHCPYVDQTLHKLFLEFLADEKPDEGVILGDLLDLSSVSRHRRGKKHAPADINAELKSALGVLMDYRHASPDTFWTLLPGNHDDRIDHAQIDNAPALYGVAPGGGKDPDGNETNPALSLRNLLFLDELGIDLIVEDFNRAKYLLGRKITLRHGYLSGKNASANMLNKITRSTVQGHTHRLRLIYKTEHDEHDEENPTVTRVGAEAGCMAEIRDSLGYGDEEDWQQGALLAHLWSDDDFTLAPVVYAPGRLLSPSGRRYTA